MKNIKNKMSNLTKQEAIWLTALRISIGWLFFYAGITKVINPEWTAQGYLMGAKTFSGIYTWLASPMNIGWTNFLNEWGLTVIGIALILGLGVRLSSILGAAFMLLYYFPVLEFPEVAHGFIIDEHIIYALVFILLAAVRAGRYYGLDKKCVQFSFFQRHPRLQNIWG